MDRGRSLKVSLEHVFFFCFCPFSFKVKPKRKLFFRNPSSSSPERISPALFASPDCAVFILRSLVRFLFRVRCQQRGQKSPRRFFEPEPRVTSRGCINLSTLDRPRPISDLLLSFLFRSRLVSFFFFHPASSGDRYNLNLNVSSALRTSRVFFILFHTRSKVYERSPFFVNHQCFQE